MTTKKKPVKKSASPLVDVLAQRAQQATDLRYGPEVSALRQLGTDARQSYLAGSGQARAAANSIVAATNESSGGLADFLARAGSRGQETLNRIGPVSGALSNEGQLAARNHGLDVQSVAAALAQAKLRAQQAGSYQMQRLYGQYQADTGKINAQASDLAGQAGSYAQSVYQSLLDDKSKSDLAARKISADARNKVLDRANSRLVAGIDVNGQVIPGSPKETSLDTAAEAVKVRKEAAAEKAKKDAKGKPNAPDSHGNTPKQRAAAQDAFTKASVAASTYEVGFKNDWEGLYRFLVTAKNLNPIFARAAAQNAVLGRIGPGTAKTLTRRGVKVPARKTSVGTIVGDAGAGKPPVSF